jgi:hypothetical protein
VKRPKLVGKRALARLHAAANAGGQRILQFGLTPPGVRCSFCKLSHPLAPMYSGWMTFYVCITHALVWNEMLTTPRPPAPPPQEDFMALVPDDPRPRIEAFKREGVIVKDIGCVLVEGFEAQGPAFVTELRTIDKKFRLVCVSPKEAQTRTPKEFLIFRCRAILHGIRTMLDITDNTFSEGTPNNGGYKT